jgi:hypothetical protein
MFLAPGDQMLSTVKEGGFGILSGTSMACPTAVSAYSWVLGLLKSRCKSLQCLKTPAQLAQLSIDLMCKGADPVSASGKSVCGIISTERSTRLALNAIL